MLYPELCQFGDILDFLPDHLRGSCGLDNGRELSAATLRKRLPRCAVKLMAHCTTHNRMCHATRCDKHVAGSPCTDSSSFGKGLMFDGKQAKYFYVWVAMRRALKEKWVTHENVVGFGTDECEFLLGDIYIIIRIVLSPIHMGWRVRRLRQFLNMYLKVWVYPVLKDIGKPTSPESLQFLLNTAGNFSVLFHRHATYDFTEYMIASADSIETDRAWAAARSSVKERHAHTCEFSDPPDSFLGSVSLSERRRLVQFVETFGVDASTGTAFDLAQSIKCRYAAAMATYQHS